MQQRRPGARGDSRLPFGAGDAVSNADRITPRLTQSRKEERRKTARSHFWRGNLWQTSQVGLFWSISFLLILFVFFSHFLPFFFHLFLFFSSSFFFLFLFFYPSSLPFLFLFFCLSFSSVSPSVSRKKKKIKFPLILALFFLSSSSSFPPLLPSLLF